MEQKTRNSSQALWTSDPIAKNLARHLERGWIGDHDESQ